MGGGDTGACRVFLGASSARLCALDDVCGVGVSRDVYRLCFGPAGIGLELADHSVQSAPADLLALAAEVGALGGGAVAGVGDGDGALAAPAHRPVLGGLGACLRSDVRIDKRLSALVSLVLLLPLIFAIISTIKIV